MTTSPASPSLAHATIPAPRTKAHLGLPRLEVFLRSTQDGRFRWFLADGTPTVVDGDSVAQAIHVAQFAWPDVQLLEQHAPA
jgi:hypothetical protein